MTPLNKNALFEWIQSEDWKTPFSESVLKQGFKIARAKQVINTSANELETGDIEISAQVHTPQEDQNSTTITFWLENDSFCFDPECSCPVATHCIHTAALLEHLSRPGRLNTALGIENTSQKTEQKAKENLKINPSSQPNKTITFHLDLRTRPDDLRVKWLPENYATAHAIYGKEKHTLTPSGNISPPRNRAAEMEALNTLYALDLLPGAETPPASLQKQPRIQEILWAPDKKKWQPSIYWSRFHHEAIPALEKRGWKVTISDKFTHQPLTFKASSWHTEIVEEGKGWFHLSAGFEIDGEQVDLQPILATLVEYDFLELTKNLPNESTFLIFLPDGQHAGRGITLPVGRFRKILTHLGELMDYKFTGKPIKIHKIEAPSLCEILAEDDPHFETPHAIKAISIQNSFQNQDSKIPLGLKATLRSYQAEGFQWMQFLSNNGLHGILADDMGLGKTMQSLTHILAEKEKGNTLPNLIIAPTSVVENWQREAAKFAPDLKVIILQGHDRHQRFQELTDCDIALTSYALIHRDLSYFTQQEFHLLILDEAQHIKNPEAQVSRAVRELHSHHRICLSGTPIENHLGELWSLFDFLMPDLLGSAETFRETFRTPIEKNNNQARADALAQKVGSLILRRTKDEVAKELPPKTSIPHLIELGNDEKDIYETVRSTMDKHVRKALAMRGQQAQIAFLDALLKLRQICCHPALVSSNHTPESPAKFNYLKELLTTLRKENRKVLLFSQFTSMLDIIEQYVISQNMTYLKLTGATKNRQDLVEIFQKGQTDIFLISLKAGGTGLTLTAADTVIHYDPWWNPAAENQATDRAYRIGQDKPVFVHKLICRGTVEERIQTMQDKKQTVADSILTASLNQLKLDDKVLTNLLAPIPNYRHKNSPTI